MNRQLTEVVKNLLIINGLFFLAKLGYESFMYEKFALFYPLSDQFSPHQLVTHMFMHGGTMHILFNMFALFMFGPTLEMRLGSKRFLTYYMITGLGAAALHLSVRYLELIPILNELGPDAVRQIASEGFGIMMSNKTYTNELWASANALINGPTVGASGAVFGILLAYGMLFPNSLIYVYFAFPIKAKHFVIIYGAIELYSGLKNNPGDNVAHFAHLGGMLFGFFLIRYWRRNTLL